MERRNIDFGVAITREQWDQLGRTAAARHQLVDQAGVDTAG